MSHKVCFKRMGNGEAVCHVDEGKGWKHYSLASVKSTNPMKDDGHGFGTFQAALKAGYLNCGLVK